MSRTNLGWVCLALGIAYTTYAWRSVAADPSQPVTEQQTQSDFMRQKLDTVATIVEGLATDDFDMVRDGADQMMKLRESAQWEASKDPFYSLYSRSFGSTIRELQEAAGKQDMEKATFAYVHLTMACTACHQRVRNVKRVAVRRRWN